MKPSAESARMDPSRNSNRNSRDSPDSNQRYNVTFENQSFQNRNPSPSMNPNSKPYSEQNFQNGPHQIHLNRSMTQIPNANFKLNLNLSMNQIPTLRNDGHLSPRETNRNPINISPPNLHLTPIGTPPPNLNITPIAIPPPNPSQTFNSNPVRPQNPNPNINRPYNNSQQFNLNRPPNINQQPGAKTLSHSTSNQQFSPKSQQPPYFNQQLNPNNQPLNLNQQFNPNNNQQPNSNQQFSPRGQPPISNQQFRSNNNQQQTNPNQQFNPNNQQQNPNQQFGTNNNQQQTNPNQQFGTNNQQQNPNQQFNPNNQPQNPNQQFNPNNQPQNLNQQFGTNNNQQQSNPNQQFNPNNQQPNPNQPFNPNNQQSNPNQQFNPSNQQQPQNSNQQFTPTNEEQRIKLANFQKLHQQALVASSELQKLLALKNLNPNYQYSQQQEALMNQYRRTIHMAKQARSQLQQSQQQYNSCPRPTPQGSAIQGTQGPNSQPPFNRPQDNMRPPINRNQSPIDPNKQSPRNRSQTAVTSPPNLQIPPNINNTDNNQRQPNQIPLPTSSPRGRRQSHNATVSPSSSQVHFATQQPERLVSSFTFSELGDSQPTSSQSETDDRLEQSSDTSRHGETKRRYSQFVSPQEKSSVKPDWIDSTERPNTEEDDDLPEDESDEIVMKMLEIEKKKEEEKQYKAQLLKEQQEFKEKMEQIFKKALTPAINQEAAKDQDAVIQDYYTKEFKSPTVTWSGNYVVSCDPCDNPYKDQMAVEFANKPEYKNNRVVKLFSERARHLTLRPLNETIPAAALAAAPSVPFLSDMKDSSNSQRLKGFAGKETPTAQKCFIHRNKTSPQYFQVLDVKNMEIPKRRFLKFHMKTFDLKVERVEPIFFTAYLVANGEVISEPWHFCTQETPRFIPSIKTNPIASFELPKDVTLEQIVFIVILNRSLLPDNGSAINKHYMKPSTKITAAAKDQAKFWKLYPNVLAPFAWTFVEMSSINLGAIKNGSAAIPLQMPPPYVITGPLKQYYKNFKSVKEQQFPFSMTFHLSFLPNIAHANELAYSNDCVLRSILYPPEVPLLTFHHCLFIRLITVNLHCKGRNIYANLSLRGGNKEFPVIQYHYSHQKISTGVSKCWYHEKKPMFDDLFVIHLPNPIPPDFHIYVEFYNAVLKNATGSDKSGSNSLKELLGTSILHLLTPEGLFIEDKMHNVGVLHVGEKQTTPNCLQIETHLDSSFISSKQSLEKFYQKISKKGMQEIEKKDCIINLFNLIDELVVGIKTDPVESVWSLVELSKKVQISSAIDFTKFAKEYASTFAFRNEETISPVFHRNLLTQWARLIESDMQMNSLYSSSNGLIRDSSENLSGFTMTPPSSQPPPSILNIDLVPPQYSSQTFLDIDLPITESSDNLKVTDMTSSGIANASEAMKNMKTKQRSDFYLVEFFSFLITKSILLTNDREYQKEFADFIVQWSIMFNPQLILPYAKFINFLFDIGHYSFACSAITTQVAYLFESNRVSELLLPFLEQVFRPKLFYLSVLYLDDFVMLIISIIVNLPKDKNAFNDFFAILLRLFVHYNDEMNKKVTSRLIQSFTFLAQFKSLPIDQEKNNVIYFFIYLLQSCTFDSFKGWYLKQNNATITSFYNTIDCLIEFVQSKENKRVLYYGIINILRHSLKLRNVKALTVSSFLVYHLLCTDLCIDFIPQLVSFFSHMVKLHYVFFINKAIPCLTKHVVKILELSVFTAESHNFLKTLFDIDKKKFSNNRRSMAICCRALLQVSNIQSVSVPENSPLYPIVQYMKLYEKETSVQISEEKFTEMLLKKALMLIHSPDACVQCLDELINYHQKNEYFAEELQTRILKMAIIIEFIAGQNRMKVDYLHLERPALLFQHFCPAVELIECSEDSKFKMQSYCDSPSFSERSLICSFFFMIQRAIDTKELEMGYQMIDSLWSILENRSHYSTISNVFNNVGQIYKQITEIPLEVDRLFGHYFRITCYGDCFSESVNGIPYIYREKKLTHLFDVTKRLTEFYSVLFAPKEIELIKESVVNLETLDLKNKGYIQITFVEPVFPKTENIKRITQYERTHLLKTFYFDTPFTKGGNNKAQGAIDQQYIRRTLLTVENPMPYIVKRSKIIDITEKEFAPIRVSYRQLKDRIAMFRSAIEQKDYRAIQQLLHGSLLVQVNEGPSRMAEIFLADDYEKSKYTQKMKTAFQQFVKINQRALNMHGKWVIDNPAFVPLQHELESGLISLVEKLSKWI